MAQLLGMSFQIIVDEWALVWHRPDEWALVRHRPSLQYGRKLIHWSQQLSWNSGSSGSSHSGFNGYILHQYIRYQLDGSLGPPFGIVTQDDINTTTIDVLAEEARNLEEGVSHFWLVRVDCRHCPAGPASWIWFCLPTW